MRDSVLRVDYFKLVMDDKGENGPGLKVERVKTMTLDDLRLVHAYHVLGLHWEADHPVMSVRPLKEMEGVLHYDGKPMDIDLARLSSLEMRASKEVQCVGRFESSRHIPCPGNQLLEGFAQCYPCISHDIPDPTCIFEPHCDGKRCGADFCQIPHVVYVTMFHQRRKIGMTQLRRVVERGTEQGADAILPLLVTKDRHGSRVLEKIISKRYGIPQAYNPSVILKDMAKPLDVGLMTSTARDMLHRVRRDWDSLRPRDILIEREPPEMDDTPVILDRYPLEEPLPNTPRRYDGEYIRGKVVGFKGKYAYLRSSGLIAVRMGSLVGKVIHTGERSFGSNR